jgi:hypothetical protein
MQDNIFTQMQDISTPRQPPPKKKHVCQGAIYVSKSKMTPQNKKFAKKKYFSVKFIH